jgi:hypothetical protein
MDFFLWSTVNDLVYIKKPTNMNQLWTYIEETFHDLHEDWELRKKGTKVKKNFSHVWKLKVNILTEM